MHDNFTMWSVLRTFFWIGLVVFVVIYIFGR